MLLTLDGIQSALLILRVEIPDGLAHDQTQLDFIVQTDTLWAENGAGTGNKDGGRGLEEEERLLRFGVVQFGDVVAVSLGLVMDTRGDKRSRMDSAGARTRSYGRYT